MRKFSEIVTEDLVVQECYKDAKVEYLDGYKEFQFPFTVSFECYGKYEVIIEGMKATVKKVE